MSRRAIQDDDNAKERPQQAVALLARGWKKHGYALGFGVGIAGGYATIGAIGYEGRLEYSAIGTVVDLAARLCGEAGDTQILISPRIFSKTEGRIDIESVRELSLKGFNRAVRRTTSSASGRCKSPGSFSSSGRGCRLGCSDPRRGARSRLAPPDTNPGARGPSRPNRTVAATAPCGRAGWRPPC